jgi:hypothetical protein
MVVCVCGGGGYHKRMGLYALSVPLAGTFMYVQGTFMYKCTVPYHSSIFLKGVIKLLVVIP